MFLWQAKSKISTMLKIDKLTSIHSRVKFARICVKIDLAKRLVPKIRAIGYEINLEYKGLHLVVSTMVVMGIAWMLVVKGCYCRRIKP